ncbi:MAG TPA: 4-phosphoerythronate dehydrogenase PdxB [Bacteroidales bacterium]|jgi:erythronate-4-phosphate dehydrogenase|nr:4-phosphoerythronate dehydrogenase PdxB [Bacteroidales bacterium]HQH24474.1 4-phosphoerythronate dehydrogenase PdxB [Bacteroidales bacterium]HQJ82548.1 4-phosphoerythronate dehydrogenase PdxB [Bacteroidales bacterium]
MKIIADDKIPFLKGVLEPFAEVIYLPGHRIDNRILQDADALLVRTRTRCNEALLRNTGIKFIATATIGYDHIDADFCNSKGIAWTNAPGCNSSSVRQYVAAALLRISGQFRYRLKNKTLGIVGVGNVGSKVSSLARILEMNVLLNDPPRARKEGDEGFAGLEQVLMESDIVTAHVPLNPAGEDSTVNLFNEDCFRMMRKGTWFINTSRGEVTDTLALKNALDSGKLMGAVLDVWEKEPDIDTELMEKTFISTPHIAGYSADGKANGTSMAVNALCEFFGFPLKDWYPDNVPAPDAPVILVNCRGKTDEDVMREAVLHTYNIDDDSVRLKQMPSGFEGQRGDYPLRREFPAYTVILKGGTRNTRMMLRDLGFKVV